MTEQEYSQKHLNSLVSFFEKSYKTKEEYKAGAEIEHLLIDKKSHKAIPYFSDNKQSVQSILMELGPKYDKSIKDGEYLIGHSRNKVSISLEPGAQFEIAVGPFQEIEDIRKTYNQVLLELNPLLDKRNVELINYGYHLVSKKDDIIVIPKKRYQAMDKYLSKTGKYGQNMMRASASLQTSVDYSSQEDAYKKFLVSTAFNPILQYYFSNTPYFEGEVNNNPFLRQTLWEGVDKERSGVFPNISSKTINSENFFEVYAKYVVSTPMMASQNGEPTAKTACELYPDRELRSEEIEHILSVYFFNTRLKNFVEIRDLDSQKIDIVVQYLEIIQRIFYNEDKLEELYNQVKDITTQEIQDVINNLRNKNEESLIYSKTYKQWKEELIND